MRIRNGLSTKTIEKAKKTVANNGLLFEHNLEPASFMWLWMKYVFGINDQKHCTNCLRGPYGKVLSKHNPKLDQMPILDLDEVPSDTYDYIYICGVFKKGYPRSNYAHNLHAVIRPLENASDTLSFENWELAVTNGVFVPIPTVDQLPLRYKSLPDRFTSCRIFRWAVCSDLNAGQVAKSQKGSDRFPHA